MAGLNRYTAQLFSTSGLTGTGGFAAAANGTTTTEAGSSNTPSNIMTGVAGAWAAGWLGATLGASKFPAVEDLNAVDYVFSYQIAYLYERGIPEYDSGTSYNIGDVCKGVGATTIFSSLTNANSGNALPTPPASNSNWHYCGDLANLGSSQVFTGGTTTGSANAQTLASVSPASGLTPSNGQTVIFTAGFTNTGAATLAITSPSISATAINKDSGSGLVALTGGEIVANDTIYLTWNSTASVWVLAAGLPLGALAYTGAGYGLSVSGGNTNVNLTSAQAFLGSPVSISSTSTFFDGPTIATTSGDVYDIDSRITIHSNNGTGSTGTAKLWDGTTLLDSAKWSVATQTNASYTTVYLGACNFTSAGNNVKVSVECDTDTNCAIQSSATGLGKDSMIKIKRTA